MGHEKDDGELGLEQSAERHVPLQNTKKGSSGLLVLERTTSFEESNDSFGRTASLGSAGNAALHGACMICARVHLKLTEHVH
jgi:hypothetical protein